MLKFDKVEKGPVIKINMRGCELYRLFNLPLYDLIDSARDTGHCLLRLNCKVCVEVKKTKRGYVIDLGKEETPCQCEYCGKTYIAEESNAEEDKVYCDAECEFKARKEDKERFRESFLRYYWGNK